MGGSDRPLPRDRRGALEGVRRARTRRTRRAVDEKGLTSRLLRPADERGHRRTPRSNLVQSRRLVGVTRDDRIQAKQPHRSTSSREPPTERACGSFAMREDRSALTLSSRAGASHAALPSADGTLLLKSATATGAPRRGMWRTESLTAKRLGFRYAFGEL